MRKRLIDLLAGEQPRVYPIAIRADVVVRIFDLPADLTQAEAAKIAAVVHALAAPSHEAKDGG